MRSHAATGIRGALVRESHRFIQEEERGSPLRNPFPRSCPACPSCPATACPASPVPLSLREELSHTIDKEKGRDELQVKSSKGKGREGKGRALRKGREGKGREEPIYEPTFGSHAPQPTANWPQTPPHQTVGIIIGSK